MANELNTPARIATEKLAQHDADINALKANAPDLIRVGFANLVTNGGFDSDTAWTKGTGLSIGSGVMTSNGTQTGNTYLEQDLRDAVMGATYLLSVEITARTVGAYTSLNLYGALDTEDHNTVGTFTRSVVALQESGDDFVLGFNSTFEGSIDNVSLWEADPADDAPWLRMPFGYRVLKGSDIHPLASVQRDNDVLFAEDFTEIWRNGQCFIKPNTTPGVSTKFSIVGYKAV